MYKYSFTTLNKYLSKLIMNHKKLTIVLAEQVMPFCLYNKKLYNGAPHKSNVLKITQL